MNKFPILLRFRDIIAGNGFIARVQIDGRALLVTEDEEYWVYGVQPGAVAGGASDKATALNEFKNRYQSVLFDIAADAKTYVDFEREVRSFFNTIDTLEASDWDAALSEVRKTNAALEELPTVKAETVPSKIDVARIEIEYLSTIAKQENEP